MRVLQSIAGQYYSAHLRFFRQLCTAAKVDKVSMLAREVLDQGKCVVIGLQSTGKLLLCSVWHQFACSSVRFMTQLCMVLHQSTCSSRLLRPACCLYAYWPTSVLHLVLNRECDGFLSMQHSKTLV